MIKYKNFEFGREDEYNVNLYQEQLKAVTEGGGRGKGRPKETGEFENRMVFVGHYASVSGALNQILEMDMENKELPDILKVIEEHKKFVIGLNLQLPREPKQDLVAVED